MAGNSTTFDLSKVTGEPPLIEGVLKDGTQIIGYKIDEKNNNGVICWLVGLAENTAIGGIIIMQGSLIVIGKDDFIPFSAIVIAKA